MPAELIKAGSRAVHCDLDKLNSIYSKEEFPQQWKGSIIVAIYKKGDKTDCSNYRGIFLLPATYSNSSYSLLSMSSMYVDKIIWHYHCG
jgi:hypothetical protein